MSCGRQFRGGNRINPALLWRLYTAGKQTYAQLALEFNCSVRTIQRHLDTAAPSTGSSRPAVANVLMDTTYFGRTFGVMVFKDSFTGSILLKKYINSESATLYLDGLKQITGMGIHIQAVICDGRRGVLQGIKDIPLQMCQFHQGAIVRRYLSSRPKSQAAKTLWELTQQLTLSTRAGFEQCLLAWHEQWSEFMNERQTDETGKTRYLHKRLRSAYRSLRTNMKWLFTWSEYRELGIPNTTNALDGQFSDLKNKLRNHNGLNLERKKRFIDEFFKASG